MQKTKKTRNSVIAIGLIFILLLIAAGGISYWVLRSDGSGTQGAPGLSAYEIAVENGFEGTVEDWLASLQGQSVTLTPQVFTSTDNYTDFYDFISTHNALYIDVKLSTAVHAVPTGLQYNTTDGSYVGVNTSSGFQISLNTNIDYILYLNNTMYNSISYSNVTGMSDGVLTILKLWGTYYNWAFGGGTVSGANGNMIVFQGLTQGAVTTINGTWTVYYVE